MALEIRPGRKCLILPPKNREYDSDVCIALEPAPPAMNVETGQVFSDIWLISINGSIHTRCPDPLWGGMHRIGRRAVYLMPLPDDDEGLKLFGELIPDGSRLPIDPPIRIG